MILQSNQFDPIAVVRGALSIPNCGHLFILAFRSLGGVDKFEPVSCGGEVDHAEEAAGELVVAGGDGRVDLEVAEHALDAVALPVKRSVVLDLHAAV